MRAPEFETSEEGKDALATVHGISGEVVDELFSEVDEATAALIEEYEVEDGADTEPVQEYRLRFESSDVS